MAKKTGLTPGKRAFEAETGIKEHVWRGVLWTKWTDALKEVGLAGNQFQAAYPTELLLKCAAEACRHYGRFPNRSEIELYGKSQSSFPSEKALRNRFPKRFDLQKALAEFVRRDETFSDLIEIVPEPLPAAETSSIAPKDGHVYLIKSGLFYKIGQSDQLERRVKEIRVALPDVCSLVHSIKTDDPPGIEAYWHRRFAHLRANGEWFKLGPNELKAFRKRTSQ